MKTPKITNKIVKALKQYNLSMEPMEQEFMAEWRKTTRNITRKNVNALLPDELYNKVIHCMSYTNAELEAMDGHKHDEYGDIMSDSVSHFQGW